MKEFMVSGEWEGRRLTRFLEKVMPSAGMGLTRKLLRLGDVKVNGKHGTEDTILHKGFVVTIYADDGLFAVRTAEDPFFSKLHPKLTILYEDEHLLLADKRPGLVCHPDEGEKVHTLLTYVQAYLYQKGEWRPDEGFAPALCNRIDRFTGGIVIVAKDEKTLHFMDEKIRGREIEKYYLCIACGHFRYPDGVLKNYLLKPPEQKKTQVLRHSAPGAKEAVTWYQVCDEQNGLSLVECLLGTGRTHQIRAQMAAIGHPLLGDSQYGDHKLNEKYGRINGQELYAYRMIFRFEGDAGEFKGLNGRIFQVKDVPFVREYFPGVVLPESEA